MRNKDKGPTGKEMLFAELVTRKLNQNLEISHEDAMMLMLDILDVMDNNNIKIK